MSDSEFYRIVEAGFVRTLGELEINDPSYGHDEGFRGLAEDPPASFARPIVERLTARPFRDAAFSAAVKTTYADTCALTGIKIVNGGGRTEVQAAHIRPVAQLGPDSIRNGIALSGTVHWMFDRGLISIDEDHRILVARNRLPESVKRLLNADGQLRAPSRPELSPHPQFLRYHREHVFKG